jgi:GT2 family glycosyltransferase
MSSSPRVSVVIPAYWSQTTLARCLEALRRQTRPPDEIIVVNSSPESETAALIRGAFPEVIFEQSPVRLLPHAARNRGVELATGDLLVFTDPDCEADPNWLAVMLAAVAAGHQCLVGAMDVQCDSWLQWGVHLCKFHWLLPNLPAGVRVHASTGNACYTRSLWQRIGPFPGAVFCGDGVLAWRAAQAGHVPRFVPEAVVRHHHDLSVAALCLQRFRRGQEYGQVRMEREQAARLSLLFSPAALPWVMGRAGRDALAAGWTARFLATVPVQVLGHALWALGEFSAAMWPAPSQPRQPGSLP